MASDVGDGDLSFDMLFDGPPSEEKPNVEIKETYGVGRNYQCEEDSKENGDGESIAESPLPLPPLSASAPQPNVTSASSTRRRTRTRSRKRSITTRNEKEVIVEKDKLSVFVYGCHGKKLAWKDLLSAVEKVGQPSEYYHKDGQCFGFIQFQSTEVAAKAAEALNNTELGETLIGAECCSRSSSPRDPSETPLVKNSILVIKNLPYNMKEDKLLHILHAFDAQTPEDVSFHHDSSGTFRGMAFVKYFSVQDASFVFDHINSIDVGGRPIKVEYKRKPDPADEDHQKIQQQLQHFKDSDGISDLAFPFSLSNSQRKQIHLCAEKLGLRYQSFGENENRYIVVSKKKDEDDGKSPITPKRKSSASGGNMGSWSEKGSSFGAQKYGSSWSGGSSMESSSGYRSRSLSGKKMVNKPEAAAPAPGPLFVPKREPTGPDGSSGFSAEYRLSRQRKK